MRRKLSKYFMIAFHISLLIFMVDSQVNLLLSSDFESIPQLSLISPSPGLQTYSLPSNQYNWYDRNTGNPNIPYKRYNDVGSTWGVQLTTTTVGIICQQVQLKLGMKYRISYSLYCNSNLKNMTLYVNFWNYQEFTLFIQTPNTFSSKYDYYTHFGEPIVQICFFQIHYLVGPIVFQGGLIDNITLVEIPKLRMNYKCKVNEKNSTVSLVSDIVYTQLIAQEFQKQYTLSVPATNLNVASKKSQQGYFQIIFTAENSFSLDSISLTKNQNISFYEMEFEVFIGSEQGQFYILTYAQKLALSVLNMSSQVIGNSLNRVTKYTKIGLSSYLILGIMNFQITTLFYVFLRMKNLPQFAQQIYQDIIAGYFEGGSILSWLQSEGFVDQKLKWELQEERIPELIEKQHKQGKWFGYYGISARVVNNNIQFYLNLAFLFVKIGLIKLLFVLSCSKIKRALDIRNGYLRIVWIEAMNGIPMLLISSITRMMGSCGAWSEMVQKNVQIFVTFFSFLSFFCHLIFQNRKRKKKKNVEKKMQKYLGTGQTIQSAKIQFKSKNNNKQKRFAKRKFTVNLQLLEILMPSSVVLCLFIEDKTIFFIINSVILIFKWVGLILYVPFESKLLKMLTMFTTITYSFHHIIFLTLYIFQQKRLTRQDGIEQTLKLFGFLLILLVILGVISEVIKVLLSLILGMSQFVQKLCQDEKIYPEKSQQGKKSNPARKSLILVEDVIDQGHTDIVKDQQKARIEKYQGQKRRKGQAQDQRREQKQQKLILMKKGIDKKQQKPNLFIKKIKKRAFES